MLLPILWYYIKRTTEMTMETNAAMIKALEHGFTKVEHAINEHDEKMDKEFVKQKLAI